ncbi:MAG: ribbon-helix-helix protein, CopG family [Micrococcales bacterium]|nr:ribbon-helix-helix protein, CopG family [Micrococcales bacterium]
MATNLRLRPETEAALRAESERTGRSQQELIREALDQYLRLSATAPAPRSMADLVAAGVVRPPDEPFRRAQRLLELPEGVTSLDLLDREDRF